MARKRVLIVDDEAPPRAVIRELLQRYGYEPAEAGDGLEGLAKAETLPPDVILLEGRMRGLDGYEVCRRLKANPRTQHIPVIFVTGVDEDELYALADEVGAAAFITKPFHLETLVAVIAAALTNREATADPPEAKTPPARPTVLCIDDDPLVLHFYRDHLEPRYRTLTVTDGLQSLAMARQDRPDVILLDILLRGWSGFDICRKLRADPVLGDIPIILISVLDDPSVARTAKAVGATLTLRKPADAESIVAAIEHVLQDRGRPAAD
jgi:two-component system cell cycle response regulator